MEALLNRILTVNLIATTVIFYVAARVYLLPHLGRLRPQTVLVPILLLHSLRHLGLMFLTRGATYPGLPPQFAYPAALGDLLSAVLAFVTIFPVFRRSASARSSTLLAQSIYLVQSLWPQFTTRLHLWDPLIGFPRFGFLLCW
jgi:hypothetical protein